MHFCSHCGREIGEKSLFCPYCGERVSPNTADLSSEPLDEEVLRLYIGKNADRYLKKFRAFQTGKEGSFVVTWNWPAFWLGFIWMLYRKMYLWALIAFILVLTPIAHPLTMIGWGICGNFLYYRQARRKILEYKSRQALAPGALSLKELGGVNRWVWFVGIVLILFMIAVMIFGFLLVLYFLRYPLMELPNLVET